MKKKLWYITRSYTPEKSGGILMRVAQSKLLSHYFDVRIITPAYSQSTPLKEKNILRTPFFYNKNITRLLNIASKLGFLSDYLAPWTRQATNLLIKNVRNDDILFCTSGGDLASLLVGYRVKRRHPKVQFVINYRDPTNYTQVDGHYLSGTLATKNKIEYQYLKLADLVITSSESYATNLCNKYPQFANKIHNNFFGYIHKTPFDKIPIKHHSSLPLQIVYGGAFDPPQEVEILAKAAKGVTDVHIHFIGNWKNYSPITDFLEEENMTFHNAMTHKEFIHFMLETADIGFLSLGDPYYGACVPSKLYEYINLCLPILASIPKGSAKDIIEENQIGWTTSHRNVHALNRQIIKLTQDIHLLKEARIKMIKIRDDWSMPVQFQKTINLIHSQLQKEP
jgi:hypothetical protein